jgi:phage baseplate assembly protein W
MDFPHHWLRPSETMILFTAPGKRVMRPDFGCGCRVPEAASA